MLVASHSLRSRRRVIVIAALGAALLVPSLTGGTAVAAATTTLQATPAVGHPQQSVTLSGAGYTASELVKVYFDSTTTTALTQTMATAAGSFANLAATVPVSARPGSHAFVALGLTSHRSAHATFLVRTDWPLAGFGPPSTYSNPYENVINAANVNQLRRHWSVSTEWPPVVVGGLAYVASTACCGNIDAVSAATGTLQWRNSFDDEWSWYSPVADSGRLYVVTGDLGQLTAFDAATGAWRWSAYTENYATPPFAANGVVYAATDLPPVSTTLYTAAFDGATGAIRWKVPYVGYVVAVANGVVYSILPDDSGVPVESSTPVAVYALDARNGRTLWSTGPMTNLSVAHGLVYAVNGKSLLARDAKSGALRWKSTQQSATFGSTAVAGNVVYADTTYAGASRVHAYDALTGSQLWSTAAGGTTIARLSVANGLVFVATANGRVTVLTTATGATRASLLTGYSATPIVVNGTMYLTIGQYFDKALQAYMIG